MERLKERKDRVQAIEIWVLSSQGKRSVFDDVYRRYECNIKDVESESWGTGK